LGTHLPTYHLPICQTTQTYLPSPTYLSIYPTHHLPTYLPTYLPIFLPTTYLPTYLPTPIYLLTPTYLPTPTYLSTLPTSTYQSTYTYLSIYLHLPIYLLTPTYTNPTAGGNIGQPDGTLPSQLSRYGKAGNPYPQRVGSSGMSFSPDNFRILHSYREAGVVSMMRDIGRKGLLDSR
jgi:hypothetical protein